MKKKKSCFSRRALALGLLSLAAASAPGAGCSSDHGELSGQRDSGGGAAGAAGTSTGGTSFPTVTGGAGTGGSTTPVPPPEPPGEDVLTIVHGVVDAERVAVCFVRSADGETETLGEPLPEGGLGFGESLVLTAVEGASFVTDAIQPILIAGDLELIDGLDCAEAIERARAEQEAAENPASGGAGGQGGASGAGGEGGLVASGGAPSDAGGAGGELGDAGSGGSEGGASGAPEGGAESRSGGGQGGEAEGGASGAPEGGAGGAPIGPLPDPPLLRVGELYALPAGTLTAGRSYLMVPSGCIGGPAFRGSDQELACGAIYSSRGTSLSMALVQVSRRTTPGALGLQVVNASVATGSIDVRSAPPPGDSTLTVSIAIGVAQGTIQPRTPRLDISAFQYGIRRPDWRLQVSQDGTELYSETWGAFSEHTYLDDGRTYALVVIGPRLNLSNPNLWNPSRVVAVPSDPETESTDPTQP